MIFNDKKPINEAEKTALFTEEKNTPPSEKNIKNEDGVDTFTSIEDERLKELVRKQRIENDDAEANMKFREILVEWVKKIVSLWLVFTCAMVIIYFILKCFKILVPPVVICTLLATTTANILGLMAIVLHGLFDKKEKKK